MPAFDGYQVTWLESGTASLAFALKLARARAAVDDPEVVLPGYGCPDLVAAADHAGLRAVLADVGADDPGYDLDSLARVLSPKTVAVVAVNFLGIRDRLDEIRAMLRTFPAATLVEDDAQWFPESDRAALAGDAVVFSFGRGKPVSLLGGGAVAVRDSLAPLAQRLRGEVVQASPDASSPDLRIRAYNALLNPWLFPFASRNPLLELGRTRYHAQRAIAPMDARRLALLPANVARYRARQPSAISALHGIVDPASSLPIRLGARTGRLLRYPVLCRDRGSRDRLLDELKRAGLGASAMYERSLPAIDGVRLAMAELPGASSLAARLLTLPVHEGVDSRVLIGIKRLFAP